MGLTQKLGTIPLAIQTDSSNNVGIGGAANASYKLAVTGASLFSSTLTASGSLISNVTNGYGLRLNRAAVTNYNGISHATGGVEKWFVGMRENLSSNNYVIYNEATGADALTISTSNNNVGIGTSSPDYKLHVVGNVIIGDNTTNTLRLGSYSAESFLYSSSAIPLTFYTNGTERMRIASGGNVLFGTTTSLIAGKYHFDAAGSDGLNIRSSGASNNITLLLWHSDSSGDNQWQRFYTDSTPSLKGSITYNRAAGLTVYNTTSDYRLKSEISNFNALHIINNLNPKQFRIENAKQKAIGFIAHELQEYFPQAVSGKKDEIDEKGNPIYQSVDYSQLTALLTKAIQELSAKVTALENK